MSKIAKWNLEKTKVKVVFRLQFHATHIPQVGWDKLFISFIPTDSGKATAKTTKAIVRNGTCKWGDPIYETTRLLQDVKSKQYDDKLYKFVVAMGSSRSSILGEACINLADYADALKPSSIALPLHGCSSVTILHVTVQLLTSKTGFREFEQQRELRERGLQGGTDLNRHDGSGSGKTSRPEESVNCQIDKVNARVRFKPESKEITPIEEDVGSDSAVGFDGSSNTSESLYADKHDTSSTHEIDSLRSTLSGDLNGISHCQSLQTEKGDPSDHRSLPQGSSDCSHGWASDYSVDNDLAIAYEENSRLRGSLEAAESAILELKMEVNTVQSHADEIGTETQKFAQQLASEIASGETLAKEIAMLKSECAQYRDELEQLKNLKMTPQVPSRETSNRDPSHLVQDKQLKWLNGLLVMEDKIRELQNKVYIGFHQRDSRLLHSELELLLGILHGVKEETEGAISMQNIVSSEETSVRGIGVTSLPESEPLVSGTGFDVDFCQSEGVLNYLSIPGPMSLQPDPKDATEVMQAKIFELLRELDESKVEKEGLARKMDQMECYYEALIQELEENQKHMVGELQNLRNEHSTCLSTIANDKAEMEAMRQDTIEQISRFSREKHDLDSINKELERRAVTSEAALKRARLNYSIAVGQLQKDLDLLSLQVLSMFETNENLIKQTFSETSQPCFPNYADRKQNHEEFDAADHLQDQNRQSKTRKQILGGDILLEDLKNSLHFQEEIYQKVEEELSEMHLVNVQLDVFSKILEETLLEESADIIFMKEKIDKLGQQLKFSNESQQLLMLRLQTVMDEVHILNEEKTGCIAKCNDLVLQNQILDAKVEKFSKENCLLTQKIKAWEKLLLEYQIYESKYEACSAEKMELVDLLEKGTLESGNLRNEISSLKEELRILKAEYDAMSPLKENLEKIVNFVEDKIWSMLSYHHQQSSGLSRNNNSLGEDLKLNNIMGAFLQLEEIQRNTCEKILQLLQEKKNLEKEVDVSRVSLSTSTSELLVVKQKFKHDLQNMLAKLDMSAALVEKFQLDLEGIASKLHVSSEAEEKYAEQNKELFSGFARLEAELHHLTSQNRDLAQEILGLDATTDELSRCKLIISGLTQEKQDLMTMLNAKIEDSVKLASEIDSLKESSRFLHDELHVERSFKDKVEDTITDLNTQLDEKHSQLQIFNDELSQCKLIISELTQEKQDLMTILDAKNEESVKLASEVDSLKESSRFLHDELHVERSFKHNLEDRITDLNTQLDEKRGQLQTLTDELSKCKLIITELSQEKQDVMTMLGSKTEESLKLASEIDSLKESSRFLHEELHAERSTKIEVEGRITDLNTQLEEKHSQLQILTDELSRCKLIITDSTQGKQDLMAMLVAKSEESVKMVSEIDSLKEGSRFLHDELLAERSVRNNLEDRITDLKAQLDKKHDQLIHFSKQNAELAHFQQLASELEFEKSRVCHLLQQQEENLEKLREETSRISDLDFQLSEVHENSLAADIVITFIRSQYKTQIAELGQKLQSSERLLAELQRKSRDTEAMLDRCLASESHYVEENAKLIVTVESVKSELEATVAHSTVLLDSNSEMIVQLEEYKKREAALEFSFSEDKNQQAKEVGQLRNMLMHSEEDIDSLITSKEELEIRMIVFKAILNEQQAFIMSMEEYNKELMMIRNQRDDLSRRLSEQMLKTEEFKSLSIHLKDLKDKAEAECLQARSKKEPEGPSVAVQESLRIAFIKEQYETRLQELKNQLSVSKKHGEEMLLKLQDAINEVEMRKKSEASNLKRNEELSLRISELEAELQSFVSEKHEKLHAYDQIKAELDCTLLSLECCKEEKQKLEALLQECDEERSRIAVELQMTKGLLNKSPSLEKIQVEQNGGYNQGENMPGEFIVENSYQESPILDALETKTTDTARNVLARNISPKYLEEDVLVEGGSVEDASLVLPREGKNVASLNQDILIPKGVHGIPNHAIIDQGVSPGSDLKHPKINGHFRTESLKSSMDHLQAELERMKNENSLPQNDNHFDPSIISLERELMQLNKANEDLESIFPCSEFPGSGNALERVLALEIELAEALRAKKNSTFHFQSSFLKLHSDEAAVLQSFRDINELIKDMLEVKGRYAAVDTELREMHDRYSQLSLQFAEVEGERQKLMMTLKNVRASKKLMYLNRSSSATLGE